MTLSICISYITKLGKNIEGIEMVLYQEGEKMTLYPRDDDHANLLIDGFQCGCYNECIINDFRGEM